MTIYLIKFSLILREYWFYLIYFRGDFILFYFILHIFMKNCAILKYLGDFISSYEILSKL